jgi:hypothetical protein
MDNPDDERTIINVKGINVRSYEGAKKAANKAGETMGSWLSRAMDQLANLEAGERYIPPDNPANRPPGLAIANPANPAYLPARPPVDFREVAAVIMALKEPGLPVQKRIGHHVNTLLNNRLREARGLPEEKVRGRPIEISHGLTEAENGKASSPGGPDHGRDGRLHEDESMTEPDHVDP